MISDFGIDPAYSYWSLGFGAKTTEVSHLRSKIKKTSYRKSRKAFRKRSRKSSSQRRTRERWGFRLPERFLNKKPWPHDLGFWVDFAAWLLGFGAKTKGSRSEIQYCKNVYPSMPLKTCFLLDFLVIEQLRNNPQREKRNPFAGEKIRKISIRLGNVIFGTTFSPW